LDECVPAWDSNSSSNAFIAFGWQKSDDSRLLSAVNYASHPGQCYVRLPFSGLCCRRWKLHDLSSAAECARGGADLETLTLYLDMMPWQCHVFEMRSG
jgi:hypothetical protein